MDTRSENVCAADLRWACTPQRQDEGPDSVSYRWGWGGDQKEKLGVRSLRSLRPWEEQSHTSQGAGLSSESI